MKTKPSCVPQVCKFGRYVILMSGCLFVRSVMHLMCFRNWLVLRLFCFLYFLFFCLKIKISVIKGNNFYYTCGCAFQFLSVIHGAPHWRIWAFFSIYGHCSRSPGSYFTFKKSCLKHATFWICDAIIPKSLHLGLLPCFIPLGTKLRVLKADWLRGHREGNVLESGAAFHLLPTSRQALKLIMLGTNVTEVIWNTSNHEHVTAHTSRRYYFSNNGVITQIFLRRLHVGMRLSYWKCSQLLPV